METPLYASTSTLGEIATVHPGASQVLLRHGLDFCCGGRRKFVDACESAGLSPERVFSEIVEQRPGKEDERWDRKPLPEVIGLLLTRYHEPLRVDLEAFLVAARKVERVHAAKESCPHGLAAHLERTQEEILEHLAKEEQILFPPILGGSRGSFIHGPVAVLMREHDDHGDSLRKLRALTTDFVPPYEACATWRALYEGLARLEAELMEHIHIENNVLFPRVLAG